MNPYVPYNLRINSSDSTSVELTWNVDSAIAGKSGSYYRLYTSANNINFTPFNTVAANVTTLPKSRTPYYIKVASVIPTMGESAHSNSIEILPEGLVPEEFVVAKGPTGLPAYLTVDAQGNLLVKLADNSISISLPPLQVDMAQEAVETHEIYTSVDTATAAFTMPFTKFAEITSRIFKLAGDAENTNVKVYNKALPYQDYNIIWEEDMDHLVDGDELYDNLVTIVYVNYDSLDEILVKLTPDLGTNNNYFVAISGKVMK